MRDGPDRGFAIAPIGAAVACALAFALTLALPAAAQERRGGAEPTVTVQGSGKHEAKPSFAVLTVEVATPGDTLDKATSAHEARAGRAAEALRALAADGVTVERSDFRLARDGVRPKQNQPGYRAVTSFALALKPVDRVDALVGRIAATGLFEIGPLGYRADDSKAALDEARRKAIADAHAKAEVFAAAADMRLVGIVAITEGGEAGLRRAELASAPSMQIVPPATLTFDASATVTWRIGPR
ncbi:SIMPL domain-containing protein [Rhodoplanes sp. TEM]|uniref:SIMPL domain-containing protein n=1 Tax=Rhodoplanes tepidamans TaxID=200616 RepID=A0ABT5JJM0_RHOTP|nr:MULTISPECIES: SIMPL domain-containing protein [Rhodoplanes]MDC7789727.1 SIMPL domain-containing protein [Rhodoplanes tepidamans]MDC7985876.1 SIMPL domain-containing protein [Rhodoplanes sp. TEM]MDQ0354404.1 uncharacterized protein YggE [Rhodoplanes tepidamans]